QRPGEGQVTPGPGAGGRSAERMLLADGDQRRRQQRQGRSERERGGVPEVGDRQAGDRRDRCRGEVLRGGLRAERAPRPERARALGDGGERQAVVGDGDAGGRDQQEDRERGGQGIGQGEQRHHGAGGQGDGA